jgi:hypothetical protein
MSDKDCDTCYWHSIPCEPPWRCTYDGDNQHCHQTRREAFRNGLRTSVVTPWRDSSATEPISSATAAALVGMGYRGISLGERL